MMTTRLRHSYKLRSRSISKESPPSSSGKPRRSKIKKIPAAAARSIGRKKHQGDAIPKPKKLEIEGGGGDDEEEEFGGPCPRKRSAEEIQEGYMKQCRKCAHVALEHINRIEGVTYELVEVGMGSNGFMVRRDHCFYFHSNFRAKPVGAPPSETLLFFAETMAGCRLPHTLKNYSILGPPDQASPGLNGCLACGPKGPGNLHHPTDPKLFHIGTRQFSVAS